jgi:hypothetical protein
MALFGVALARLGLVGTVAALVLVAALAYNESRPLERGGIAVALIGFSVSVFVWLLGLPIPLGP